jgi:UDP-N-acetyl-D-galactosamine dehydrogenase
MGAYVAHELTKLMTRNDIKIKGTNILILGFTFKEDCPDVRNTRVIDIYNELKEYNTQIDIYDPWANPIEVEHEYGLKLISETDLNSKKYEGIILAVSHKVFSTINIAELKMENGVIYDVKGTLPKELTDGRL